MNSSTKTTNTAAGERWTPDQIERRIHELGKWFHNMNLGGVWTAPNHFLGDYPNVKWQRFSSAIPDNLRDEACWTSAATRGSTPSR